MTNALSLPTPRRKRKSLKRQAGATLVESAIVALIIAGLIGGAIYTWQTMQNRSKNINNQRDTALLVAGVRNIFDSYNSYGTDGLNAALTGTYRSAVPGPMLAGTSIVNPWGGAVTVTGTGATFTVSSAAVPAESCADMVNRFGSGAGATSGITGVSVNGTALAVPLASPAAAAAACSTASNTVLLTAN